MGLLALGTDFPVEGIDPLATYRAAVERRDAKGWPEGGYMPENALSPEDALRGMTIWNAIATFTENELGSLEPGKWADFVVLDGGPLGGTGVERVRVSATYLAGEQVK
jgi:predicted amidohydrolase YtcJ